MKRGIPIALQAAGAVLACLATTLNHPVMAFEQNISMRDTVHYYDKRGKEIYRNTKAATAGNYIIKTSKLFHKIFDEWEGRDTTKKTGDYKPADVFGISGVDARKAKKCIRRGNLEDTLVKRCTVQILDMRSIKNMLDSIRWYRIKDKKDKKFREYGGKINADTMLECKRGDSTNPQNSENKGIVLEIGKKGNFHSHPEGHIDKDSGPRRDPNHIKYDGSDSTRIDRFIQGPSCRDQLYIGDNVGYVFGMGTKCIYIYGRDGVYAIMPFRRLPAKTVNK